MEMSIAWKSLSTHCQEALRNYRQDDYASAFRLVQSFAGETNHGLRHANRIVANYLRTRADVLEWQPNPDVLGRDGAMAAGRATNERYTQCVERAAQQLAQLFEGDLGRLREEARLRVEAKNEKTRERIAKAEADKFEKAARQKLPRWKIDGPNHAIFLCRYFDLDAYRVGFEIWFYCEPVWQRLTWRHQEVRDYRQRNIEHQKDLFQAYDQAGLRPKDDANYVDDAQCPRWPRPTTIPTEAGFLMRYSESEFDVYLFECGLYFYSQNPHVSNRLIHWAREDCINAFTHDQTLKNPLYKDLMIAYCKATGQTP